jgi:hypothetical protein
MPDNQKEKADAAQSGHYAPPNLPQQHEAEPYRSANENS